MLANSIHILRDENGYIKELETGQLEVTLIRYDNDDNPTKYVYGHVVINKEVNVSKKQFLDMFLREMDVTMKEMNKDAG